MSGQCSVIGKGVFCVALCAMLFALCSFAAAQQPKKVTRIGYLSSGNSSSESARAEAIRLALRELGYIEGQNIATEYRYAEGKIDQFPEVAARTGASQGRCHCGLRGGQADLCGQECD
jgi:hypothetical protein